MIKNFIAAVTLTLIGAMAMAVPCKAQNWVVDTSSVQKGPGTLTSQQLADHKLYVENLKAAGFSTSTANWGQVDTRGLLSPDHSKVIGVKRAPDGPSGHMVEGR